MIIIRVRIGGEITAGHRDASNGVLNAILRKIRRNEFVLQGGGNVKNVQSSSI